MSLVKPVRAKGEQTYAWISRRDSYRLDLIEKQIKELQKAVRGNKK